jgi:hypothetical protein
LHLGSRVPHPFASLRKGGLSCAAAHDRSSAPPKANNPITYTHKPAKPRQTRMSSPKTPKSLLHKTHNRPKIKHLQAKNKAAKTGILVWFTSIY